MTGGELIKIIRELNAESSEVVYNDRKDGGTIAISGLFVNDNGEVEIL